jgi:hypothetical protein
MVAVLSSRLRLLLLPVLFATIASASPSYKDSAVEIARGVPKVCKCTAFDSCWPSPSEFAQLSDTLSSPIFQVQPLGTPCHDPTFNAALCDIVKASFSDGLFRTNQPGAAQTDNWEFNATSSCFVNGDRSQPCGQGRVPIIGVNATTISDIQKAVQFAIKHNLKVKVKNTG